MVIHGGVGWVQELRGMEEVTERLPESAENRSLRELCLEGGMAFGRRTQPLPDPRRAGTERPRGRNDTFDSLPPPSLFCPAPVGEIQQEARGQRSPGPSAQPLRAQAGRRRAEGQGRISSPRLQGQVGGSRGFPQPSLVLPIQPA